MFNKYTKVFEEGEKTHCTDHLKNDGFGGLSFGIVSYEFKQALEENNEAPLIYYDHYVCGKCGYPSEFYVRFCYWCEGEFYGVQSSNRCTPCKKKYGD